MKTQATPKTAPVKKTSSSAKKTPGQNPLLKTATDAAQGAEKSVTNSRMSSEEIAARAYKIWQQQGCPEGREEQHWAQAEKEVLQDDSSGFTPLS